jgi:hypothetical protein
MTDGEKMVWAAAFVANLYKGSPDVAAQMATHAVEALRSLLSSKTLPARSIAHIIMMCEQPEEPEGCGGPR